MNLENFSLVPSDYRVKDPRGLVRLFPKSIMANKRNLVSYNKRMSKFMYYHSLEVAEHIARLMDFILLPATCMHWRRAKQLGEKRRVNVGRNVFYLVKENELTELEKQKILDYVNDFREAAAE